MQWVYLVYILSVEMRKLYQGYIFEVNFMITKRGWQASILCVWFGKLSLIIVMHMAIQTRLIRKILVGNDR